MPDHDGLFKLGEVEFSVPDTWTKEVVGNGILLMAPNTENNWQANLFLEFREDSEGRTLEQGLADLVANLSRRKKQFREVSRKVETNANGLSIAHVTYTCVVQQTALTHWEIIAQIDSKKRFFVLASSASTSLENYQPVFERFISSLRRSRR
jgi:hypothetical protein